MYEIYVLSHSYGINPFYVESLPPVDRDMLLYFVRREIEQEREAREKQNHQN